MKLVPDFWKTSLEDIEECVKSVRLGETEILCTSPGKRPVYMVRYGKPNKLSRTANLSSALGAGDRSCYADKSKPDYRPVLFLVGCIHGGEFEGTAALINLISIMETGKDYAGTAYPNLKKIMESINLLIIPCANPDGRSHVPFNSFVGRSFYELRYYNQGTWKDGSLCNWPDCKKVHPIKDHVDYLGGYFNDDGVNIMHDNFFGNKAAETEAILMITEKYAPDFSVLLHGGTNTVNMILKPAYVPRHIKEEIARLEDILEKRCKSEGLDYRKTGLDCGEDNDPPSSFNLISAMYHLCGEPCITYESNQGLTETDAVGLDYSDIYKHHIILFEELGNFLLKGGDKI